MLDSTISPGSPVLCKRSPRTLCGCDVHVCLTSPNLLWPSVACCPPPLPPPRPAPQVSDAVVRVIEELEPTRQAIFEAQTAFGQTRWNEHLAVDLRLAGERPALQPHPLPNSSLWWRQAKNLVPHS